MNKSPNRRWIPRYGLRTLFVVVTLFACWLGWEMHYIRERKAMICVIENDGFVATVMDWNSNADVPGDLSEAKIPFWREWLGDEAIAVIHLPNRTPKSDLEQVQSRFPEAKSDIEPAIIQSGPF